MNWKMHYEAPVGGHTKKGTVTVVGDDGSVLFTDRADLISIEERHKLAERLAGRLRRKKLSVRQLEDKLEASVAEALNGQRLREQERLAHLESPDSPAAWDVVPYAVENGRVCRHKTSDGFPLPLPLCNFTATIVEQVTHDDGAERTTRLALDGASQDGRPFPRVVMTAEEFTAMNWPVKYWGPGAVTYAGQGTKDHLRAAIQLLSGDVHQRTVYSHTGWQVVHGRPVFLHAGGGIGLDGQVPDVEVELAAALHRFKLPSPPQGAELVDAARASLQLRDVAPPHIAYPLLAGTYRAPLGGADFSLFLFGQTQVFKSEIASLFQRHYGAGMDRKNLPANWSSTENALEALAFAAKDSLLTIDDFSPRGPVGEVQSYHRKADRVFRAMGNHAGRQRLDRSGVLRPEKPPRGLILSTGEEIPAGQSVRARLAIVEVRKGDVQADILTSCQRKAAAGVYAKAMAGYIQWLARRYDAIQRTLESEIAALREQAQARACFARTPEIVANLAVGWRYLLAFAAELGAVTKGEAEALWQEGWRAFGVVASTQAMHQEEAEPAGQFVRLLRACFAMGKAHMAGPNDNDPSGLEAWGWRRQPVGMNEPPEWRPQGAGVGWLVGADLFLEPEASFAVVQDLAKAQGESVPVNPQTLRRRLQEKGLLASTEKGKLTIRRTLAGKLRVVIHLRAADLYPEQPGESGEPGDWSDIHEEASVKTKEQDEHGTSQTSIRHHPRTRSAMREYAVAPIHTSGVALRHVGPRDAT